MGVRDSSLKTITKFLIKVFHRSQPSFTPKVTLEGEEREPSQKVKAQNNVDSVSFYARACWKAQKSELNTLPSGHKKQSHVCHVWFYILETYINLRKRNVKRKICVKLLDFMQLFLCSSESLSRGFSP